jgi:2-dehydro-3-deoxyphosphogluconate aldolase / (4S)-4-hydroxy-2-oxoglutarate aldolase
MALDVFKRLSELKVIPVVAIEDAAWSDPMGAALVAAGLPIAEVTFRTAAAVASIKALAKRGDLLVGAGTVLNIETVKKAVDGGAKFIVTPGFNANVVDYCVDNGIPITPGTVTATEIGEALEHGLNVVKFFPAEASGGIKTLKAIGAAYSMMRFVPTGGITPENLGEYLKFGQVLACGGSWMVAKELLANKQFDRISQLARQAVDLANQARRTGGKP